MRGGTAGRSERAAWAWVGGFFAASLAACQKDPDVTTRPVTLHAPQGCAAGVPTLDATALGFYRALGDFESPAPSGGHSLGLTGAILPELDTAARSLLVEATAAMDREWQGVSGIAGSGAVDVLLLPALTSCSLHGALTERPGAVTAPAGASRVLVVGGGASAAPTVVLRLDTGSVAPATPDLGTPRNRAAVTAFGPGALVAGGVDAHGTVLSQAEVYDATTGGFDKSVIALATARADAGAVVLATGETLLVGGVGSDGKTVLGSMELVDPVTRTSRTTNLGVLEAPRRSPTVLRLASGEILVAGGVDASGTAVPTLEWFSADASHSTQRTETLVTGSARAYMALQGGGALAVIAPPSNQDPGTTFQNTWILGADGPEPATPIPGALSQPELFGGAGGAPVLWTGDRWLRWEPWLGAFGALDELDDTPANVGTMTASPDPGLAVWIDTAIDTTNAVTPRFTALRFDVRGEYSPLSGPLLVTDATDTSPDRLATDGDLAFDPTIANGALTLNPGASAFVTDRTYADVRIQVDAPTGAPALLVLRDPLGSELEIGGASCPGAVVTGSPLTLTVERRGAAIDWTVSGGTPSNACPDPFAAGARLSIGVRGAPDLTRSVARNLRVTRLGTP